MRFTQKVALVTGAGSGIGAATAKRFAREGAAVACLDINEDGLRKVVEEITTGGGRAIHAVCNVSKKADVDAAVAPTIAELGGLHCVVNNAGITRDALLIKVKDGSVQRMSLEAWQQVIDVNLTGVFLCAREAATHMVRQGTGGVIVSLSSISRGGNVGQTNYTASKAGVAGMTVTFAKELARYGIRAAAIAPGYVSTEMTEAIREDIRERIVSQIPLGRMASMEEISHALRFVLENDYVSGRVIEVDGAGRM